MRKLKLRHRRSVAEHDIVVEAQDHLLAGDAETTDSEASNVQKSLALLESVVERMFIDIDSLRTDVDTVFAPTGHRESPAQSCRDIYRMHPEYIDGWYWIDPNQGMAKDAIQVWCNMSSEAQTCVYPRKGRGMVAPRKWRKPSDKAWWFSQLEGGFKIDYAPDSQLAFLRMLHESVSQTVTFHCSNTIAFYDKASDSYDKAIGFMGHNDFEFSGKQMRKKFVQLDNCSERSESGFAVFNIKPQKAAQLPVVDLQIQDFGKDTQKFGFEVGPVCFN